MRISTKALLIPVALAVVLAAPAAAQAVTCGQVVKDDLTLKSDLDCSAGGTAGLIVGANDITIDLGGKTIKGAGPEDNNEGILNEGHDNVTIKNGVVTSFKDQVYFSNVAKNRVTKLSLRAGTPGVGNGVYSSYGTGNRFVGNRIFNPNYGFQLINGSQNTIAGNKIIEANRGVFTTNEAFDDISDNVSKGFSISTTAFYSQADYRNTYENDVADGGYQGFYVNMPRGVLINGARANDNGYAGIYVDSTATCGSCSAAVKHSEASKNSEYGIYAVFPIVSRHNTALGNRYYNCHLAACNG